MARLLFWEPYNKAKHHGDFRDLIKAIKRGDPLIMEPEVRALIARQLESPKGPSRKTQSIDGWPLAREVYQEMRSGGISAYAARNIVLERHPGLNAETLKTYCRSYDRAIKEHRDISEENQ